MIAVVNRRWFASLSVVAGCLLAVPATFGQSTAWAPSRSATRPGDANAAYGSSSFVPEWQRTPGTTAGGDRSVVRASASVAASTGNRAAIGGHSTAERMGFDVQLAPGEKLVGQPTYSEGRPLGGETKASSRTVSHFAPKDEILPTPDSVSSRRTPGGEIIHEGPMLEGEMHFDPDAEFQFDGDMMHGSCSSCGDGSCGSCLGQGRDVWGDPPICPDCGMYGYHFPGCNRAAMCLENCYGFIFRESSVFLGVQSFKGPLDQGQNGNYGFNEGFNLVGPLVPFPRIGVGYQVGARWAQSNLSGNNFGSSSRNQSFITAAIFHRAYRNRGLQWGVAYDWLTDDYYVKSTLAQLRFEMSWLFLCEHEIGFWGAAGVKNDSFTTGMPLTTVNVRPMDQYNFFYRYTSKGGSQARFWGGITGGFQGSSFGIAGADFRVPMSNRADLVGGFNYIIPNDGGTQGTLQESWGLGMNLVWYFGRRKDGVHNTPFRPLFNVADNTVFMHEPL